MKVDLWISLLLAIPLAIAANLLTPHIRSWLDRRAEKGASVRLERTRREREASIARLEDEIEEIENYRGDRAKLHELLLETVIRATLYGAIGTAVASLMFTLLRVIGHGYLYEAVVYSTSQFVTVVTSLMVFQVCWRGLKVIQRVRNFDQWVENVRQEISHLKGSLMNLSSRSGEQFQGSGGKDGLKNDKDAPNPGPEADAGGAA